MSRIWIRIQWIMESLRNSVTLLKNFYVRFVVSKLCMPRFPQEKQNCLWLPNPFVSVERMQILVIVIEIDSALWPFGNYLNSVTGSTVCHFLVPGTFASWETAVKIVNSVKPITPDTSKLRGNTIVLLCLPADVQSETIRFGFKWRFVLQLQGNVDASVRGNLCYLSVGPRVRKCARARARRLSIRYPVFARVKRGRCFYVRNLVPNKGKLLNKFYVYSLCWLDTNDSCLFVTYSFCLLSTPSFPN